MVDIIPKISGVEFESAWPRRDVAVDDSIRDGGLTAPQPREIRGWLCGSFSK